MSNKFGIEQFAVAQVKAMSGNVKNDMHGFGLHGFRAIIIDSESNRLALHSVSDA